MADIKEIYILHVYLNCLNRNLLVTVHVAYSSSSKKIKIFNLIYKLDEDE